MNKEALIFHNHCLDIYFNKKTNIVCFIWKNSSNDKKLRTALQQKLFISNELDIKYAIIDLRKFKKIKKSLMTYANDFILPLFLNSGIKKIAYLVTPTNIHFNKETLIHSPFSTSNIKVKNFTSLGQAEDWLLDVLYTVNTQSK